MDKNNSVYHINYITLHSLSISVMGFGLAVSVCNQDMAFNKALRDDRSLAV